MPEITGVSYWKNGNELKLERIAAASDIEREHAVGALALMADAYERQFAEPNGSAPPETFRNYFDHENSGAVERQLARMVRYVGEEDSQYWLFPIKGMLALGGLSKVTPSRSTFAQKARFEAPNCYVNDIVVASGIQKHGIGSALMHAPLSLGGFEPDKGIALDAYKGSGRLNSWFERLGLLPTGVEGETDFGGHTLRQLQYSTTPFVDLAEVRRRLEIKHPWLTTAKPHQS